MINNFGHLVNIKFYSMMVLVMFVLALSCGQDGGSNDATEKLTDYCIRECVLETAASEICDNRCKCAAEKLSSEYSKADFSTLAHNITHEVEDTESDIRFKRALSSCFDKGK